MEHTHFLINGGETICGLNVYTRGQFQTTRNYDLITCPRCLENITFTPIQIEDRKTHIASIITELKDNAKSLKEAERKNYMETEYLVNDAHNWRNTNNAELNHIRNKELSEYLTEEECEHFTWLKTELKRLKDM